MKFGYVENLASSECEEGSIQFYLSSLLFFLLPKHKKLHKLFNIVTHAIVHIGLKEQISIGYLELSDDLTQRLPVSKNFVIYLFLFASFYLYFSKFLFKLQPMYLSELPGFPEYI